ncbi:pre-toxin TG domain-containing protein, partial [Bacillus safensis]|uniref:pre-toxin TG domain-containing protein n=1 Tax=Bacillus safensis TaxID=561879 RepID=UPI00300065F4
RLSTRNVKGIKKLKEFDIADEVVTDPSALDYIGGRYTVYANKQIIRTYIANGKVNIEEVDHIPASRSHGNVKRILDGEVVSAAENIILEYSGIYDGYRAITGKDPETNQNISSTDQALSAVSIIPFMKIIKGGKYVFKINQGKHVVKRVEKTGEGTGKIPSSNTKVIELPEKTAPRPVKPQDATNKWEEFLGEGEYSNIHPIKGTSDPNRIFSADGKRSIRYGNHEMGSKPTKHHYHEEIWGYEPFEDTMTYSNTIIRVPIQR